MSCWQKIELENTIFRRACKLRTRIYARSGRWISCNQDVYLQALLRVYNAFFYEENRESFCTQENSLASFAQFKKRSSHVPVFSAKEYNFELILGGNHAAQN